MGDLLFWRSAAKSAGTEEQHSPLICKDLKRGLLRTSLTFLAFCCDANNFSNWFLSKSQTVISADWLAGSCKQTNEKKWISTCVKVLFHIDHLLHLFFCFPYDILRFGLMLIFLQIGGRICHRPNIHWFSTILTSKSSRYYVEIFFICLFFCIFALNMSRTPQKKVREEEERENYTSGSPAQNQNQLHTISWERVTASSLFPLTTRKRT